MYSISMIYCKQQKYDTNINNMQENFFIKAY